MNKIIILLLSLLAIAFSGQLDNVYFTLWSKSLLIESHFQSKWTVRLQVISWLICSEKKYQKLFKTSLSFVPNMKRAFSIELFPTLWFKEETSLTLTELEADQSLEIPSTIKTFCLSTSHSACPWPTEDQTQTEVNFSSQSPKLHGSMTDTSFSEKLLTLKVKKLLRQLRQLDLDKELLQRKSLLLNATAKQ